MDFKKWKLTRRQLIKAGLISGAGMMLPWKFKVPRAFAVDQGPGLSDPALQPKFTELVPNALHPGFIYNTRRGKIKVAVGQTVQYTGLVNGGTPVPTTVWGYGDKQFYTWPGRTFQVKSNRPLEVKWENRLIDALGNPLPYIITGKDNSSLFGGNPAYNFTGRSVVDTSLHWAYSLMGYEAFNIATNGVPIVAHVHGGHSDFQYDGNPEFFFSPGWGVRGPQWVEKKYLYDNSQPAGTVWYHDHALGITRLNVYAGMAGFYIIRDDDDTGLVDNPLDLPAFPYEAAFAIQDKMFKADGELFYPAFPGDPFYDDFITGEGATLPPAQFPGGGPTALAEFFGDHMVVNGKIWPKMNVEPRNYRLRLLNGCDSRFLVIRFREAATQTSTTLDGAGDPITFTVIGSDQGLASSPTTVDTLVFETGSRYDIIFDFNSLDGKRIIMENIGGDTPFGFSYGDDLTEDDVFENRQTDRIMAFDVVLPSDPNVQDVAPNASALSTYATARAAAYNGYQLGAADRVRKVALFEGTDEYGRLQPILGSAEPATDFADNPIYWPETEPYITAGLAYLADGITRRQIEGATAWHSPTTENPALDETEVWEVYNVTGDSHPIHLHLVHFQVLERREIIWDSNTIEDDRVLPRDPGGNQDPIEPAGDGTYLVTQPLIQHNSTTDPATWGSGFKIMNPTYNVFGTVDPGDEYVDGNSPKDMVTARPDEVTFIKAKFDKPGRYVWHCHILSHEDHEMMRVMHVGPGA
jgi:FtsP/CotA-like multicopper oxidase with cupredoxin domain